LSPSTNNSRPARWIAALLIGLCLAQGRSSAQTSALPAEPPAGDLLVLSPGQIRTLEAPSVQRVAVGDPGVVDVTIVSSSQILVQAKAPGSTNVLLWDAGGQRELRINVVDPTPSAVAEQLPQVLEQLNVPGVRVKMEGGKVFLVGEVLSEEQLQSVEQLAQAYQGTVVSLVTVRPAVPPPAGPVPMVKLSMQVVEINRSDLEKLGALSPTASGCTMLHKIASVPSDTMRTRWAGYRKKWQDDENLRELVPRAQELLIELGPTLVEEEMLQP